MEGQGGDKFHSIELNGAGGLPLSDPQNVMRYVVGRRKYVTEPPPFVGDTVLIAIGKRGTRDDATAATGRRARIRN